MGDANPPPASILIVGGGVFGLSTALSLAVRPSFANTRITLLEAAKTFPNPSGSSVDSSRIVRPDYANPAYARLGAAAQDLWRNSEWGANGRYHENGLVLVADSVDHYYVRESMRNMQKLTEKGGRAEKIQVLENREQIQQALGVGEGASGHWGYVNWMSGWADAGASVDYAMSKVLETHRVEIKTGTAEKLIRIPGKTGGEQPTVTGVQLTDGTELNADLVVLATGAWTGKLVDMRGRAEASGQVMVYVELTEEEQREVEGNPTILNLEDGNFVITPKNRILKIARHGFGYWNPTSFPNPDKDNEIEIIQSSLPMVDIDIPMEGERVLRQALRTIYPKFGNKPFVKTRICWYTDTPTCDFIVTYHPEQKNLFLATGGSGHGFKFLPVIGEKIVDAIERKLEPDFQQIWNWPTAKPDLHRTLDGSRGGPVGMILQDEIDKDRRERSRAGKSKL